MILDRELTYQVLDDRPFDVFSSSELPQLLLTFRKASDGELWKQVFVGDSVGQRSADPPFHKISEVGNEILIDIYVPEGTGGRDCSAKVTRDHVEVTVNGWGTWRRHVIACEDVGRSSSGQ